MGEARSLDEGKLNAQTEHMIKCLEDAAAKYEVTVDGVTTRGRVESNVSREYSAMDVSDDSRVVRLVKQAGARMGLKVETMSSGGGCDANIFNKRGIECANLGTGMRAIHTVKEWLDVKDMYASAEMTTAGWWPGRWMNVGWPPSTASARTRSRSACASCAVMVLTLAV